MLLPGATVLARLVTSAREATTERLLLSLGGRMSPGQTVGLEMLLVVEEDSRASRLERRRQAPTRVNSTGMVSALERLGHVEALGVSAVDVSELRKAYDVRLRRPDGSAGADGDVVIPAGQPRSRLGSSPGLCFGTVPGRRRRPAPVAASYCSCSGRC